MPRLLFEVVTMLHLYSQKSQSIKLKYISELHHVSQNSTSVRHAVGTYICMNKVLQKGGWSQSVNWFHVL